MSLFKKATPVKVAELCINCQQNPAVANRFCNSCNSGMLESLNQARIGDPAIK
jgi:hypothetical protein